MATFRPVVASEVKSLAPGTILWLPPKDQLPVGTYADPKLLDGGYNHPVIIVSYPPVKEVKYTSRVEIAIVTSFHGNTIKSHLAQKGINYKTGTLAAQKAGYLRIVTSSKPHAKDVLKLRNGKGMKRDCAYVNVKQTFGIEIAALAKYGGKGEDAELTAHAIKALVEAVLESRKRKRRMENSLKSELEGAKEKEPRTGTSIKKAGGKEVTRKDKSKVRTKSKNGL
ncbi:uncharacterized protein PAC_04621 [Phialocephala subalpina]|uniref:Uncharacterized protein n=1 Tax=Phialocephala subalpina TaxID=576137 RepID=A0A1L7WPP0_9HELO|nr:uncharacterized protein PAC_04621 [Phialocephala subalpina]